jgi:hypothetical protein
MKDSYECIYRPFNSGEPKAMNATIGVRFSQGRVILDPWLLIGGTRWSRTLYRLKHPFVYSNRGLRRIYRRIRRIFIKDKPVRCTGMGMLVIGKEK